MFLKDLMSQLIVNLLVGHLQLTLSGSVMDHPI